MLDLKNLQFLTDFGIYNDDSCFFGVHLKHLPPLRKLFLRPHNIDFDVLIPLISKSKSLLKKICVDCEILEQKQLYEIITKLNEEKLETLMLNFCDKFDDEVLILISRFKNLKKFKFSKGNSVKSDGFYKFFNLLNCDNLLSLNLSQCSELENDSIMLIADKARNLRKINISWCIEISSIAVNEIFQKCIFIKKLYLTGIKKLNKDAFPYLNELLNNFDKETFFINKKERKINMKKPEIYFKTELKPVFFDCYMFMKYLNVRSCDFIVDEVLIIFKLLFPFIKLINYYGEEYIFE